MQRPLEEGDEVLPALEPALGPADVIHPDRRIGDHVVGVVVPLDVDRPVEPHVHSSPGGLEAPLLDGQTPWPRGAFTASRL